MKRLLLIVGLVSQAIVCSDVIKELKTGEIDYCNRYLKNMADQELASVAQQLDELHQLLMYQEATPTVQPHTRQELKNLITVLEQKFVKTVELFDNEVLSPEDVLEVAQELFDASCPPLLAHLYGQK